MTEPTEKTREQKIAAFAAEMKLSEEEFTSKLFRTCDKIQDYLLGAWEKYREHQQEKNEPLEF